MPKLGGVVLHKLNVPGRYRYPQPQRLNLPQQTGNSKMRNFEI